MKRRHFVAELMRGGRTLAMADAYAMNSAIRASEALVREHARAVGAMFEGEAPERYGDTYTRRWTGDGETLTARVVEVYS